MADEIDTTFEPELNPDLFEAEDVELEDFDDHALDEVEDDEEDWEEE
jgi:hypothetical protein